MAAPATASAVEMAARRVAKKPERVPDTSVPKTLERQYHRELRKWLRLSRRLVKERLEDSLSGLVAQAELSTTDGLVTDAWPETLARIMAGVRLELSRQLTEQEARQLAERTGKGVIDTNRLRVARQLRTILGIDVLGQDPDLRTKAAAFTADNVKLIKSVPEQYLDDVEELVSTNVRQGLRAYQIVNLIRDRYGVSDRRAALIAEDQTHKFNGELTRTRHESLGITHYIWRTARDGRVRSAHAKLDGKKFKYKHPPVVDPRRGRRANPGGDYRCRCTAEPWIPGIDDKVSKRQASSRALNPRPRR